VRQWSKQSPFLFSRLKIDQGEYSNAKKYHSKQSEVFLFKRKVILLKNSQWNCFNVELQYIQKDVLVKQDDQSLLLYLTSAQKNNILFSVLTALLEIFIIFILTFVPDTKSIEHKHTLPAQRKLEMTDTERFVTALGLGLQDNRHNCLLTRNTSRAGLKAVQPMQLHWAPRLWWPRATVFGCGLHFGQILLAFENCRKSLKISLSANHWLV